MMIYNETKEQYAKAPSGCASFLTEGKLYKVIRWETDGRFYIQCDMGLTRCCLTDEGNRLFIRKWTLVNEKEAMPTPCAQMGYEIGDEFMIIGCNAFAKGSIVRLMEDDGSIFPKFAGVDCTTTYGDRWSHVSLYEVEPRSVTLRPGDYCLLSEFESKEQQKEVADAFINAGATPGVGYPYLDTNRWYLITWNIFTGQTERTTRRVLKKYGKRLLTPTQIINAVNAKSHQEPSRSAYATITIELESAEEAETLDHVFSTAIISHHEDIMEEMSKDEPNQAFIDGNKDIIANIKEMRKALMFSRTCPHQGDGSL